MERDTRQAVRGTGHRLESGDASVLRRPALLAATFAFTAVSWSLAAQLWSTRGEKAFAVSVFAGGLSLGPCLAGYLCAPKAHKQTLRRIVLFTGGLSMLAPLLLAATSLELEGFFMLLFAGTMGAAVGHTLITVIVGPLVFGRLLCGWGCWRAMILELLPIRRRHGARERPLPFLPYAGLAVSIGAAAFCYFQLGHRPGGTSAAVHGTSLVAAAVSCGVYYLAAIGLAFLLKDPRAFCKYLCPSGAILRWTSRPALVRMRPSPQLCDGCGACSRACPMDIRVAQFAAAGRPVSSGDCILCQRCAQACPTGALRPALPFGRSVRERAEDRPPRSSPGADTTGLRQTRAAHV